MIRKLGIGIITVLFVGMFSLIVVTGKRADVLPPPVAIPENHVLMENMYAIHVMSNDKGFATLRATTAYIDANSNTMTLSYPVLEIKENNNTLISHADKGIYVLNENLTNTGNLYGTWNDLEYTVEEGGYFYYDFTTDKGNAQSNVHLVRPNAVIDAESFDYDGQKQLLNVRNVEMVITPKG